MPCSGCSALHGVNPNKKKVTPTEIFSCKYREIFEKQQTAALLESVL